MRFIARERALNENDVDTEGSWAISYGDMITLLLSFFVLYFTADFDKVKIEQINSSLVGALKPINPGSSPIRHPQSLNIGKTEGLMGIEQVLINEWGARVHQIGRRLIVEFPGISFYDSGWPQLNSKGKSTIAKFAEIYTPYAGNYVLGIRAYTDKTPVKEGARYKDNLELSALRSVSAMRWLQKEGIPLRRMKLAGYGEHLVTAQELALLPEPSNYVEKLALARKVVFVIEPEKEGGS
jgi:chemotaxis protein MotB